MFYEYWQVEFTKPGEQGSQLETVLAHEYPRWTDKHQGCIILKIRVM